MAVKIGFAGNLAADAEVRTFQNGDQVVNLTVITTDRAQKDGQWVDTNTNSFRVEARNSLGRNAASLKRGDRVIVEGSYKTDVVENQDGTKSYFTKVIADDLGVSLKYATAQVTKNPKGNGGQNGGGNGGFGNQNQGNGNGGFGNQNQGNQGQNQGGFNNGNQGGGNGGFGDQNQGNGGFNNGNQNQGGFNNGGGNAGGLDGGF